MRVNKDGDGAAHVYRWRVPSTRYVAILVSIMTIAGVPALLRRMYGVDQKSTSLWARFVKTLHRSLQPCSDGKYLDICME